MHRRSIRWSGRLAARIRALFDDIAEDSFGWSGADRMKLEPESQRAREPESQRESQRVIHSQRVREPESHIHIQRARKPGSLRD